MALTKVEYVKDETVITADNLNDIQDNVITNASKITGIGNQAAQLENKLKDTNTNVSTLQSSVSTAQSNITNLQSSVSSVQNAIAAKVRFVEQITLSTSGWSNLQQVVALTNILLESDTPHITLATVTTATKEAYGNISYAMTYTDSGVVKLKFVCLESVPTVDLVLQVEVIR